MTFRFAVTITKFEPTVSELQAEGRAVGTDIAKRKQRELGVDA